MRSTMKALEDELGTALVSQLNTQDQQEVKEQTISYLVPLLFFFIQSTKNVSHFFLGSMLYYLH